MQTQQSQAWAAQRQRQYDQQAYYQQQTAAQFPNGFPTLTGLHSQAHPAALGPALPVTQQDQFQMKGTANGRGSNRSSTTQGSETPPEEEEVPKYENGEPISKRTLQNRKAQREFRQRRTAHLKDLEERVRKYEAGHHEVNIDLQRQVMALRDENDYLRGQLARLGHEVEQPRLASYQPYPLPSMPTSMPTTPLRASYAYPNSSRMSLGPSRHSHSPPASRTPSIGSARSRRGLDSEANAHPGFPSFQQQQVPQQMQEVYPASAVPAMRQVSNHNQQHWAQPSSLNSLLSAVDSQRSDLEANSPQSAPQSRRSSQTAASPLWPQNDFPHPPPAHPPPAHFQQSPVIYEQHEYGPLPPIRHQTRGYNMMPVAAMQQQPQSHHQQTHQQQHQQQQPAPPPQHVQEPAPVDLMEPPSDDDEKDADWTPDT